MTALETNEAIDAWLPPQVHNQEGAVRRVGVEIELAGVTPLEMASCLESLYGGELNKSSATEIYIEGTSLGKFVIELDSTYFKSLHKNSQTGTDDKHQERAPSFASEILLRAAEQFVPWEIVSPPIAITDLPHLCALIELLRSKGALGTRHALQYAFGVHLNPELPDLEPDTILRYLRAYLCLYDWIVMQEGVDTTRRITTYISHFDKDYIAKVIDPRYAPSQEGLIDDYLKHNPTRNRSLDLLPLFAHLDEQRVRNTIDDPRITARPTFHYRLPNCDIDNPEWNIDTPWQLWLEVEKLAHDIPRLARMCSEYQDALSRLTHPIDSHWAKRTADLLTMKS